MKQGVNTNTKEVMIRLAKLQAEMNCIREYLEDIELTEEDIKALEDAEKEYKEGKTISFENLKKELCGQDAFS